MDAINDYINNVFLSLPQNEDTLRLKAELLENMRAKYEDLRQEGKSDSEAVGIVLGDFGSMDELISTMNLEPKVVEKESVENKSKEGSEPSSRAIALLSAIFWPCIVIAWLLSIFIFGTWYWGWIIYLIGGVVYGLIVSLIKLRQKKKF